MSMKDKILGFFLVCASCLVAYLEIKRENQDLLFYLVLIVMSLNFLIGIILFFRKSINTDDFLKPTGERPKESLEEIGKILAKYPPTNQD